MTTHPAPDLDTRWRNLAERLTAPLTREQARRNNERTPAYDPTDAASILSAAIDAVTEVLP